MEAATSGPLLSKHGSFYIQSRNDWGMRIPCAGLHRLCARRPVISEDMT